VRSTVSKTEKRLATSLELDQAVTQVGTAALAAGLTVDDIKAILERIGTLLEDES
jgi:hypothetical protein